MNYAFVHDGKAFTPDGKVEMTEAQVNEHNAKLAWIEVAAFKKAPSGTRWFAYMSSDSKTITNWTGVKLGDIWSKKVARVGFCDCTGRRPERHFLTVKDTEGRIWKGTSPGPGMYARLRLTSWKLR